MNIINNIINILFFRGGKKHHVSLQPKVVVLFSADWTYTATDSSARVRQSTVCCRLAAFTGKPARALLSGNPKVVEAMGMLQRQIYKFNIYDPGSRFATTPPPPHGMVPKPAFCSIPHENVVFAVFFAWWVAGAVRNPANSLDFCNQPSENVLFAMFRLRHRGVVSPRPLLFLCQIII